MRRVIINIGYYDIVFTTELVFLGSDPRCVEDLSDAKQRFTNTTHNCKHYLYRFPQMTSCADSVLERSTVLKDLQHLRRTRDTAELAQHLLAWVIHRSDFLNRSHPSRYIRVLERSAPKIICTQLQSLHTWHNVTVLVVLPPITLARACMSGRCHNKWNHTDDTYQEI